MKRVVKDFLRRGVIGCGVGPIVLAVLYLILYINGALDSLSVPQVCIGIFSITALAFVAGGMNSIYQIERLPLMLAVLIHGLILYVSYLITYLINDWLQWGTLPLLVFSGIFIVGYLVIWAIIYSIVRRKTERLNSLLKTKQNNTDE